MGDVPVPPEPRPDPPLPPQQQKEQQHETQVPKRSGWHRLLRKLARPEPSTGDAHNDETGVDPEADQRAIDDEFWNKK